MAVVVVVIIFAVLVGMIWSTDRIDNFWRSRGGTVSPSRPSRPPEQRRVLVQFEDINETRRERAWMGSYWLNCDECSMDDLPLNFEGLCPICAELKVLSG